MESLSPPRRGAVLRLRHRLQQRAGLEKPTESKGAGLLVQMAKRPVWLAGIAADALGFRLPGGGAGDRAAGGGAAAAGLPVASRCRWGRSSRGQKVKTDRHRRRLPGRDRADRLPHDRRPLGGGTTLPLGEWLIPAASAPRSASPGPARPARGRPAAGGGAGDRDRRLRFALSAALDQGRRRPGRRRPFEVFVPGNLYALIVVVTPR